jgi:hypothetical protein
VALLLYGPWLAQLPAQVARVRQAYWITPPGPAELIRTLVIYVGGSPLPAYALPPVLFTALLLLVLGSRALLRGLRQRDAGAGSVVWSAYLALTPLALMFGISLAQPIYLDRAMLPAGAAFLVWVAWALGSRHVPRLLRGTAWALLAASFGLGLASYYTYRDFPYAPFEHLNERLRTQAGPGEVVLHSNKLSAIPAAYYGPDLEHRYLADPPGSASDTLSPATQRVLGLMAEPGIEGAVGEATGVWFVVFAREREEYRALGYEQHPALNWLQARFGWEHTLLLGDLELHHFVGSPERAQARLLP